VVGVVVDGDGGDDDDDVDDGVGDGGVRVNENVNARGSSGVSQSLSEDSRRRLVEGSRGHAARSASVRPPRDNRSVLLLRGHCSLHRQQYTGRVDAG